MIPGVETARTLDPPSPDRVDQRVVLHGVSWEQYEAVLAMRGERGVPRITYLDGELELMTPSRDHETRKKLLARLVEAYAEQAGVDLDGLGSWTLNRRPEESGAEPDESYIVGDRAVDRPDFAIEVVWTSGGLSKLEVYRRLGVPEVWLYRDGRLRFYLLAGDRYEEHPRSRVLPGLDPDLLARFLGETNQTRAVRAFRDALRARRGG